MKSVETQLPRQTCCACLGTTSNYTTLTYRDGTARFHFCKDKIDCAGQFQYEATSGRAEVVRT